MSAWWHLNGVDFALGVALLVVYLLRRCGR